MSASNSRSSSSTSTSNTDKSITTSDGSPVLAIDGATLTVGNQGSINISNADPSVARDAIAAISAGTNTLVSAVTQVSARATSAAEKVADSQRAFVETASGQKAVTFAVAIVGGVVALVALPKILKSFSNK